MPESIAVIGCGPAGMFFCHALETMRREMLERGESVENLPNVTVFERDRSPGGVWRSDRNDTKDKSENGAASEDEKKESDVAAPSHNTQMYEALWTNGPKEGIEFFDYTYDEHFKRQLPVYMPRGALLEYMLARVTKNCPDFFEKYVTFQTNVTNVVFDEDDGMFHISTRSFVTGKSQMRLFDRCIWAAGDNGKPNMPGSVLRTLEGFSGKVIHSTETATLKDDVCGKRVLIVGGSYSAEDLALMACKLQVEQIYICFRSENGESPVTWTGAWPNDKVEILSEKTPVSVENGSTVVLQKTENVQDDVYQLEEGGEQTRLENIDTVILCTGYHQQYDMLEDKLKNWVKVEKTATYPTPSDWKMDENILTPLVGEVEAPEEFRYYWTSIAHRDLYRGLLIDNPKMMFLLEERDDYPILNIDVMAWMFLRFVTGGSEIPSAEEMRKRNIEQCLFEMKTSPLARFHCDLAYGEAYEEAAELRDPEWELFEQILWNDTLLEFKIMARIMQEADYPLKIGTSDELNEKGKQLYEYAQLDSAHRENATSTTTFRDAEEAHKFTSIFTGTAAISLKKPWLEIDENVDEDLV